MLVGSGRAYSSTPAAALPTPQPSTGKSHPDARTKKQVNKLKPQPVSPTPLGSGKGPSQAAEQGNAVEESRPPWCEGPAGSWASRYLRTEAEHTTHPALTSG